MIMLLYSFNYSNTALLHESIFILLLLLSYLSDSSDWIYFDFGICILWNDNTTIKFPYPIQRDNKEPLKDMRTKSSENEDGGGFDLRSGIRNKEYGLLLSFLEINSTI